MRNLIFVVFFLFAIFSQIFIAGAIAQDSITIGEQKSVYELPYPGLLPDHPLYFLKNWRDTVIVAGTRDQIKKAQYYHLLSDKHMSMALRLSEKGKEQLAVKTIEKGEEYFKKIPPLLISSKEQGVGVSGDFKSKLENSNTKHREVIEELLKKSTQGNTEDLTKSLNMNAEIRKALQQVK